MNTLTRKKLYFLLNLPKLDFEDLDRLDEIEKKFSIDLEDCSEDEVNFISHDFIRYMPRDDHSALDELLG